MAADMFADGSAARIAPLPDRALVRVEGPDWRPFLHNLLTHDMEELKVGRIRFTALLTPQGRLLHDLFVLAGDNAALLDVAASARDALIKRLTLYRLRAKVVVEAMEGAVAAAWDGRYPEGAWAVDPRLPELGWRAFAYAGPFTATADDYDTHRLELGVPAAIDAADSTYPLELNFDLLQGIDFKKGCFIGQETTSRMKRRGVVKTRAVPVLFDGPSPQSGTEVLAGELRAGEILSGREGRALALLRLDRAVGAALTAEGRPVRMDAPGWLASALPSADPSQ